MSVETELDKMINNINELYEIAGTKGATIPENKTLANLKTAINEIEVAVPIETEEKSITPNFSTSDNNEVIATEGKYLSKVVVNKDINLTAGNIKKDITINGIVGNLEETVVETEEKSIIPNFSTSNSNEVLPTEGKYLSKVTINKDTNLLPQNIKKDVSINGITGTLEEGSGSGSSEYNLKCELPTSGISTGQLYSKITKINSDFSLPSNITDCNTLFGSLSKLTEVPLFDTSNVTNMFNMFYYCIELTVVPLFNTSNVTNMNSMFQGCRKITTVPLFDTSNVTNMSKMFYNCESLTTVPEFNTSNVTDINNMFYYCSALTVVPLFNTSNVTNMFNMFYGCRKITTVPLFDTSNVINMNNMFISCEALTDESLNNILLMCTNSNITTASNKTLTKVGLNSSLRARCRTLSNYQALLDAGWTE